MSTLYAPSKNPGLALQSFRTANLKADPVRAESRQTAANQLFAWSYGMAMAFVLCLGTGSALTPQGAAQRESRHTVKAFKESGSPDFASQTQQAVAPRTAAEALGYVRDTLKPAVTELASMFKVSRQAIYNWQSGEHISEANQALVFELAAAADTIQGHRLAGRMNVKRKLPGGMSLLEVIASGVSGRDAAAQLISMAEKEGAQRAAVESRIGNRSRPPVDMSDVGSPHMYEKV